MNIQQTVLKRLKIQFFEQVIFKLLFYMLFIILPIAFVGCSGGDAPPPATTTTGGATTTPVVTPGAGGVALSMSAIAFGVNPLSAYGTTSAAVTVYANGAPYTTPVDVNFTSTCAKAGKAELTSSVTTVNSVATASYVDNGCGGTDVVTAFITDGPSITGALSVLAPESGALTFVSATPSTIALKGTGGAGTSEISKVTFKLVDIAGNPIGGKTVNFSLNTTLGGITLSSASATSDATTGEVKVDVQAGTFGTPVRVTATTLTDAGITLSSQSSQLVISSGYPDQDSFSLSVETFNIEGWNVDGQTTGLTIRLADHFNNQVPDGTAVYFTTEGGQIDSTCTTLDTACSVTLTSQFPRPADGRVTVLAYAIGEESFLDKDSDGLADLVPDEMVQDMPEAWRDDNFDQIYDVGIEVPIDFDNDLIYDIADGKFNTSLCNETADLTYPTRVSSAGSCSAQKTIHVRQQAEIVFSGSDAYFYVPDPDEFTLSSCLATEKNMLIVVDANGNQMPAGTTITVTAIDGNIILSGSASYKVPNTNAPVATDLVYDGITQFPVYIKGNSSCASGDAGRLEVKVKTPGGIVAPTETTGIIDTKVL